MAETEGILSRPFSLLFLVFLVLSFHHDSSLLFVSVTVCPSLPPGSSPFPSLVFGPSASAINNVRASLLVYSAQFEHASLARDSASPGVSAEHNHHL